MTSGGDFGVRELGDTGRKSHCSESATGTCRHPLGNSCRQEVHQVGVLFVMSHPRSGRLYLLNELLNTNVWVNVSYLDWWPPLKVHCRASGVILPKSLIAPFCLGFHSSSQALMNQPVTTFHVSACPQD